MANHIILFFVKKSFNSKRNDKNVKKCI